MVSFRGTLAFAALLTTILVATAGALPAIAAEDDPAIAKLVNDQAVAWNAGDAHAFSADVAEDVAYIELGIELTGYKSMPPGLPEPPDGVMRTHMLQVLKKIDGKWRIEAFYNVNVLPAAATPPSK